jgi:hypothetical protein
LHSFEAGYLTGQAVSHALVQTLRLLGNTRASRTCGASSLRKSWNGSPSLLASKALNRRTGSKA